MVQKSDWIEKRYFENVKPNRSGVGADVCLKIADIDHNPLALSNFEISKHDQKVSSNPDPGMIPRSPIMPRMSM
jgi:hypothetical protein